MKWETNGQNLIKSGDVDVQSRFYLPLRPQFYNAFLFFFSSILSDIERYRLGKLEAASQNAPHNSLYNTHLLQRENSFTKPVCLIFVMRKACLPTYPFPIPFSPLVIFFYSSESESWHNSPLCFPITSPSPSLFLVCPQHTGLQIWHEPSLTVGIFCFGLATDESIHIQTALDQTLDAS